MDVWRITVAALRRWYVLVPLMALTVLLALAAGQGVKEEYEVTGATMIVPGRVSSDVPNPYGGPSDANEAVAIVLNSPSARQQIADDGHLPTYEVSPESNSTIMNFRVRGASQEQATETGMAVFRMAALEMDGRQAAAGIRLGERYSIDVLQAPSVSAVVTDGRMRNMAVVGVLGSALSLTLAVLFDDVVGLVRRRRRRRSAGKLTGTPAAAKASETAGEKAGTPAAKKAGETAGTPAGVTAGARDETGDQTAEADEGGRPAAAPSPKPTGASPAKPSRPPVRKPKPNGKVPNGKVPNGKVPNGKVPNGKVPNGRPQVPARERVEVSRSAGSGQR